VTVHDPWPLIETARSPAATYRDGQWWAVLETKAAGTAPTRLLRSPCATHSAAIAHARLVLGDMRDAALNVLAEYSPVLMEEPHD